MHRIVCVAVAAVTLVGFATLGGVPRPSAAGPDFSAVRRVIEDDVAAGRFPSVAIAVSQHGSIVWEEAFGWANRERRIPATAHTMYHLASVTKPMTGTALMALQERGRLDLDRPINGYLGAEKLWSPLWDADAATVRQVANHTAGLTTYDQACYADEYDCDTSADVMIQHYGVLISKPGARFDYSNLGYGVLSTVIARVSGMRYGDFMRHDVFEPAGMTECAVDPQRGVAQAVDPQRGVAQAYDGHGTASIPRVAVAQGASSVVCSIDSLLRYAMLSLKDHAGPQRVLSDAAIDSVLRHPVATGGGEDYSLGWTVNPNRHGYRVVYDDGGNSDSKALIATVPTEDIGIVVLINGPANAQKFVDGVLAELLPQYSTDLAITSQSRPRTPPSPVPAAWRAGVWTGSVLTYTGRKPVTIVVDGPDRGSVRIGSQPAIAADHLWFSGSGFGLRARADIETPDANRRRPYLVDFYIQRDADNVFGCVTTQALPGARDGGQVSYFVTLRKSGDIPALLMPPD